MKVYKTWQWKRRKEEEGADANTVFLHGDKGLAVVPVECHYVSRFRLFRPT